MAVRERIDNIRVTPLSGTRTSLICAVAVERFKLWENGRHLRVRFLDGLADVQEKVAVIAKEWEVVANIHLDFVAGTAAELRISFAEKGFSWSTVGTGRVDRPTLTADDELRLARARHPDPGIRAGRAPRVRPRGRDDPRAPEPGGRGPDPVGQAEGLRVLRPAGLDRGGCRPQHLRRLRRGRGANFTEFDPTSIMQYVIPYSLTIGTYSVGWNTALSELDRTFMAEQYPADAPAMVELEVGGARHAADLAAGAEVDTYWFDATDALRHIVTTEGATDTVLTLHGPDDPGAVLSWDDDRGRDENARIVRKLEPGSYWVTVRHKHPGGTGIYTVGALRRTSADRGTVAVDGIVPPCQADGPRRDRTDEGRYGVAAGGARTPRLLGCDPRYPASGPSTHGRSLPIRPSGSTSWR